MAIVMDTGALIALIEPRDQYHSEASDIFRELIAERESFIFPLPVITEFFDNLVSHYGKQQAVEMVRSLIASKYYNLMIEEETDVELALNYFFGYDDVNISMTDCLVFAIMERLELSKVFTFDSDFKIHGLDVVPAMN